MLALRPLQTNNVTGCQRGQKRKLRAGVDGTWRRPWRVLLQHTVLCCDAFSLWSGGIARFLCAMHVFKVRASFSFLGYLCAKFRFFRVLQWRRKHFESGGAQIPAQSAGKFFLLCPPLFRSAPPHDRALQEGAGHNNKKCACYTKLREVSKSV